MRPIALHMAKPGMVLGRPVHGPDGRLLLSADVRLTSAFISSLDRRGVRLVFIEDGISRGIVVRDCVDAETRHQAGQALRRAFSDAQYLVRERRTAYSFAQAERVVSDIVASILRSGDGVPNLVTVNPLGDRIFMHSANVCVLAVKVGLAMGVEQRRLRTLGMGALLHDVGMAFVPEGIREKPGALLPPLRGGQHLERRVEHHKADVFPGEAVPESAVQMGKSAEKLGERLGIAAVMFMVSEDGEIRDLPAPEEAVVCVEFAPVRLRAPAHRQVTEDNQESRVAVEDSGEDSAPLRVIAFPPEFPAARPLGVPDDAEAVLRGRDLGKTGVKRE